MIMSGQNDEDVYQEHVMDHYEEPYHCGDCQGCTHTQCGKNPLCGDKICLQLRINDGKVEEAWFNGEGCCISQASASMLVEAIEGKSVDELNQFTADEMLRIFGARLTPNRQKCCLLGWRVLQQAVHAPVQSADATSSTSEAKPATPE